MPSSIATGDFGPAPPGVDLSENQNGKLLGAVVSVAICGTVAVALRVIVRMKAKDVKLALDDYLVMLGLVSHTPTSCVNLPD